MAFDDEMNNLFNKNCQHWQVLHFLFVMIMTLLFSAPLYAEGWLYLKKATVQPNEPVPANYMHTSQQWDLYLFDDEQEILQWLQQNPQPYWLSPL